MKRCKTSKSISLPVSTKGNVSDTKTKVTQALTATISVPTLYGSKDIKIPEGTQSGTVFTIKNYGIKKLKGTGKGDMFVKVVVEVPKSVSKEQKEFLKRFDQITDQKKQYPLKKAYDEKAQ